MKIIKPGLSYVAEGVGQDHLLQPIHLYEGANFVEFSIQDPGHEYVLLNPPHSKQTITFVKNRGDSYPGNEGEPHGGILSQELFRILIHHFLQASYHAWKPNKTAISLLFVILNRAHYLNSQGSCMETELGIIDLDHALFFARLSTDPQPGEAANALRQALAWFEIRAARCRGDTIELEHLDQLEKQPTCPTCGHNFCSRKQNHERLPGTWR